MLVGVQRGVRWVIELTPSPSGAIPLDSALSRAIHEIHWLLVDTRQCTCGMVPWGSVAVRRDWLALTSIALDA